MNDVSVRTSRPATAPAGSSPDGADPARPSAGAVGREFRLLWAASVLVPALIFAVAAYWTWRNIQVETRTRLEHMVDILHEHALRSFETHEAILEAVNQRIRGMSPEQIRSSRQVHDFMVGMTDRTKPSGGLIITDSEGHILSDTASFPVISDLTIPVEDYVRPHLDGLPRTFIGEAVTQPRQNRLVFNLSRRVTGDYLIVSSVRLDYFEDFYASIVDTSNDVVLLTRGDGALLSRVPSLPRPVDYQQRFHRSTFDDTMAKGRLYFPAALSPVDGQTRYYAARRIGAYPVLVSYGLSAEVVNSLWLHRVAVLATVCIAAVFLLLIFTLQAQRSVQREHLALAAASAETRRRMKAEARLNHSQRVDALGQIVGGVAHDINNLVMAVMANARQIEKRADDPAEVRRVVRLIHTTAERGARLTSRMLSFARREETTTDTVDVIRALEAAMELLKNTLGSGYDLTLDAPPALPAGRADRAEFETVIVNLVINARDAMPAGGTIVVTPRAETEAPGRARPAGLAPGEYIRISVKDAGCGMDAETLARVGEAFFTTKAPGKGTGLGLAMARSFAEQSGGRLRIDSEPGRGTTVTLWIRAASEGDASG